MKVIRLRRRDSILVCGKCLKRHTNGKAIRRGLKAYAKAADAKVVRTSCLGICPKHAVVVANRASIGTGCALLLDDAGSVGDILAAMRGFDPAEGSR